MNKEVDAEKYLAEYIELLKKRIDQLEVENALLKANRLVINETIKYIPIEPYTGPGNPFWYTVTY
jgi:hypothetical protein